MIDILHIRLPTQGQGQVHFRGDDLQGLGYPGFAHGTQAIQMCSTEHDALGTQGQGFDHVLAAAYSTVEPDFHPITDGLDDGWQHADA
ncbi:hypothetical protein D3C80_1580550 [compost metagenome]